MDEDAGLFGELMPDLARAPRLRPDRIVVLARDGDEAEIANRRTQSSRAALDHDDGKAPAYRGERAGKANDACADDGQIIFVRAFAHATLYCL